MTNTKFNRMITIKKDEKNDTRRAIIHVLRELGESSSSKIFNEINKDYKRKNKKQVEKNIDFMGFELTTSKKVKDSISRRTIQRNLRDLCEKDLVKQNGKLYSLADEVRAARYFGKRFGARVLHNVIPMPDYELKSVKDNLQNLITLFGTIVTFCCMEASRPKKKNLTFSNDKDTNNLEQLASTMSWINTIISPSSLFHYFLFTFRNQVDDDMVMKLKKLDFYGLKRGKHIWIDKKTGEEYDTFPHAHMNPIHVDDKGKRYPIKDYEDIPFDDYYLPLDRFGVLTDYDGVPYDEVDSMTYNRMVHAFRELVPELNEKLEELRMDENHILDFTEDVK